MDSSSCPWAGWEPPNLDWCEAELCAWIQNPANTWSNLAYMLAAIPMWRGGGSHRRAFALASLLVGVASFVYHASTTYFFQIGDFLGMFVFVGLPLALNAARLGWIAPMRQRLAVLGVVGVGLVLLVVARFVAYPIQLIVFAMILVVIAQELVLAYGRRTPERRRSFWIALVLLFAGAACTSADLSRLYCDPHNHWLQGHALWHLFGAGALVFLARFYREMEADSAHLPRAASVV